MDLLTILVVFLVILWLAGIGTGYTAGGALHLILFIVIIVVLIKIVRGERV